MIVRDMLRLMSVLCLLVGALAVKQDALIGTSVLVLGVLLSIRLWMEE